MRGMGVVTDDLDRPGEGIGAAHAGLQRRDEPVDWMELVQLEAAASRHADQVRADAGRARRAAGRSAPPRDAGRGRVRRVSSAARSTSAPPASIVWMTSARADASSARFDVAEFDEVGVQGEAVEVTLSRPEPASIDQAVALRDRLVGARREDAVSYRNQRDHRPANLRGRSDTSAIRRSGSGALDDIVDCFRDRCFRLRPAAVAGPTDQFDERRDRRGRPRTPAERRASSRPRTHAPNA